MSAQKNDRNGADRYGVVAVIQDATSRFLMIRRSKHVTAPGAICFPGGGIEQGESEQAALVRELREELAIPHATPVERLWTSVTKRRVHLAWWRTQIPKAIQLSPDPAEVADCFWWTLAEMQQSDELLPSNRGFLEWWQNRFS